MESEFQSKHGIFKHKTDGVGSLKGHIDSSRVPGGIFLFRMVQHRWFSHGAN